MSNETLNGNCAKRVLTNVFKMNREIKFRAWDKSCNKMRGISGLQDCFSLRSDGVCNEDYILMQYTGLKDQNGKEIYEGDIVTIEYGKGVVEYSEKQAMFIINWIGDNEAYNESLAYNPRNYIYGKTRKDIEVIGNIYENHELTQSSE